MSQSDTPTEDEGLTLAKLLKVKAILDERERTERRQIPDSYSFEWRDLISPEDLARVVGERSGFKFIKEVELPPKKFTNRG